MRPPELLGCGDWEGGRRHPWQREGSGRDGQSAVCSASSNLGGRVDRFSQKRGDVGSVSVGVERAREAEAGSRGLAARRAGGTGRGRRRARRRRGGASDGTGGDGRPGRVRGSAGEERDTKEEELLLFHF